MKKLLALAILGLFSVNLLAVRPAKELIIHRDSVYRHIIKDGFSHLNSYLTYPQGISQVMKTFENNGYELDKLDRFMQSVLADKAIFISRIFITGYCSVEGSYAYNLNLAKDRVSGFLNYVNREYNLSGLYSVQTDWVGEDWVMLRQLTAGSMIPEKDEVVRLIDNVAEPNEREARIRALRGGKPYQTMANELFPMLRRVNIRVEYDLRRLMEDAYGHKMSEEEFNEKLRQEREAIAREEREAIEAALRQTGEGGTGTGGRKPGDRGDGRKSGSDGVHPSKDQGPKFPRSEGKGGGKKRGDDKKDDGKKGTRGHGTSQRRASVTGDYFLALKTDLVTWAGITPEFEYKQTLIPNLAGEFFFLDRWSVMASATYTYTGLSFGRSQFLGVTAYSLEPRFWISTEKGEYNGFYVGPYGKYGEFDDCDSRVKTDRTSNTTGTFWQAGLSGGYHWQFLPRWGLEAGVRGGYQKADYENYAIVPPNYFLNRKGSDCGFKFTGLNISVTYRFSK